MAFWKRTKVNPSTGSQQARGWAVREAAFQLSALGGCGHEQGIRVWKVSGVHECGDD